MSPFDVLVYVLAYGGLRWGEAAALRAKDCDLGGRRLVVARSLAEVNGELIFGPTKNSKRRDVFIPEFLARRLAAHLPRHEDDQDGLVFTTAGRAYKNSVRGRGRPLRYSNFRNRVWIPAVTRAGLDGLRMHDLRHTAAALMISEGAHPKAVQAQLGHSSITVSMDRYGHLFPSDRKALAARLDTRRSALEPSDVDRIWTGEGAGEPDVDSELQELLIGQGVSQWARQDSNLRPTDYESAALTN